MPVDGMRGVAHDPQTHTVWWTLPNDRKLHNLGTLLDPPRRVRQSSGVPWDQSVLVEYAPERSATARLLDAHKQGVRIREGVSQSRRRRGGHSVQPRRALVALLDGIRTPRALGWARPDRIVVLEAMRGKTWTQLAPDLQPLAIHCFGSALANVHSLPTDFGRGPFQRYRMERVLNSAALVATARPDVAAAARRLHDKLAKGPPSRGTIVCLHGDVHANNVLFHGDQVHLIDFDQGGSGVASADLGSMLASLMAARLINPETTAEGLGAAFLAGYSEVRALPPATELRWYTAAAFVAERAIRAVNRVNTPALAVLPELLSMAESVSSGKLRLDA